MCACCICSAFGAQVKVRSTSMSFRHRECSRFLSFKSEKKARTNQTMTELTSDNGAGVRAANELNGRISNWAIAVRLPSPCLQF